MVNVANQTVPMEAIRHYKIDWRFDPTPRTGRERLECGLAGTYVLHLGTNEDISGQSRH